MSERDEKVELGRTIDFQLGDQSLESSRMTSKEKEMLGNIKTNDEDKGE